MKQRSIIIITSSIFLTSTSTYMLSQMVVQDPTANATAVQTLAMTSEVLVESKEQRKMLKEGIDKLKKVNSRINDLHMLEEAVRHQMYTIEYSKKYINQLQASSQFTGPEISMMLGNFNNIIASSNRSMKLARMVLADYNLEMNDVERIEMLEKASKGIVGCRVATDQLNSQYQRIAWKRSLYKMMGKTKKS
jgi:hypothetical protein